MKGGLRRETFQGGLKEGLRKGLKGGLRRGLKGGFRRGTLNAKGVISIVGDFFFVLETEAAQPGFLGLQTCLSLGTIKGHWGTVV